jgi:hypothetical protein
MDKIILELTKIGKDYFGRSFSFHQNMNVFVAKSDNMSFAINNWKSDALQVNVINWFDDLWLYIEIKFIPKIDRKIIIPNIIFTLSVFQGQASDDRKLQHFRAEWDNYDEQSDKHAQPHWHIYSQKEIFSSEDFNKEVESEENLFNEYIEDNANKIINTDRFHFAMNGQWSENKSDVHSVSIESDLINWFRGLLNHLKKELEYVKEK